jgi:hypothetical protein
MIDWEGLKALERSPNYATFERTLVDAFPAILAQHEQDQRVIEAAKRLSCRTNNLVKSAKNYRDAVNTTWKSQNPDDCDWLVGEEQVDEDEALSRQSDAYGALTSDEYDCEKSLAEFDKVLK